MPNTKISIIIKVMSKRPCSQNLFSKAKISNFRFNFLIVISFFITPYSQGEEDHSRLPQENKCYERALTNISTAIGGYSRFQDYLYDPNTFPLTTEEIAQIKLEQFDAGQTVRNCPDFPPVAAKYWAMHFIANTGMIYFPIDPEAAIDPLFNISDYLYEFANEHGYNDPELVSQLKNLGPSNIWMPEKVALHAASAANVVDNDEMAIKSFEKTIQFVNHPYATMADFANYSSEVLYGSFYSPRSLGLAESIYEKFETMFEGHDRVELFSKSDDLARTYDFIHFVFQTYGNKDVAQQILQDIEKSKSAMPWRDEDRFVIFMALVKAIN